MDPQLSTDQVMSAPPTVAPATAKMQSQVRYSGMTIMNSGLRLLEWGADDRIRLFDLDPATQQSKGMLFDCSLGELTKIGVVMSQLHFTVNGKVYYLEFSLGAMPAMAAGGLIGIAMSNKLTKASGIGWWAESFIAHGVAVKQFNMMKWGIWIAAFVLALIISIAIGSSIARPSY